MNEEPTQSGFTLEQKLVLAAVDAMFSACGNSYANAWLERWLAGAVSIGAYKGRCTGTIRELEEEWEQYIESLGGLPDLPDSERLRQIFDQAAQPKETK